MELIKAVVEERWRIGELARAAGLTVRTLHHYEALGLLSSAARTEAGHRLYESGDVNRLYRILALRALGLGLADISRCLDSDEGALLGVVRRHLSELERQITAQSQLRSRLQLLITALERQQAPSVDRFLEIMEAMNMFERYYTPEQLSQLEEQRVQIGDEAIKRGEQEWAELIGEVDSARQRGLDPSSEPVQALARRWKALIQQFTGGDAGIRRSLQTMYETEGAENASRGSMNPELMEYIGKAMAAGGG